MVIHCLNQHGLSLKNVEKVENISSVIAVANRSSVHSSEELILHEPIPDDTVLTDAIADALSKRLIAEFPDVFQEKLPEPVE